MHISYYKIVVHSVFTVFKTKEVLSVAGLFSHLIAGKATSILIDEEHKKIISNNKQAYYLGTQGPDLFFYYLTRVFYNSTRPLGQKLHKERVGKFLSELVYQTKHIKNEKDREIATSYLLGYLSHYVMDAYTHPYVYYKAGFSTRKKFKLSPRNSWYHRTIENNIDDVLLEYFYDNANEHHHSIGEALILPEKYKQVYKYFKMPKSDIKVISSLLKTAILKTYDINIDSARINTAINQMLLTLTILEAKSSRHKKLIILEDNVMFSEVDVERLKRIQNLNCKKDYFNFEHGSWSAPWDLDIKSESDFFELMHKAVYESVDIFGDILKYFDNQVSFNDLMDVIKNRSLAHGSDCVEPIDFKYHDVIFKKA